jgi:hypothetical protein
MAFSSRLDDGASARSSGRAHRSDRRDGHLALAALVALPLTPVAYDALDDPYRGLVVDMPAPAPPYAGPLRPATPAAPGGAGRALECDDPAAAHASDPGFERAESPRAALLATARNELFGLPRRGYRVERADVDRVLYSLDVAGRTRVAVVVARDAAPADAAEPWAAEQLASCDPAEFPRSADRRDRQIWTDLDGDRVSTRRIVSSARGPAHCGWQSVGSLTLGSGGDRRQYLRDPYEILGDAVLRPYEKHARLPEAARDSGYRRDGTQLWLTVDAAYLVRGQGKPAKAAELWPLTRRRVVCG